MRETLYIDLIAKYLSGNIEPADREQLLSWVAASDANRRHFDEMLELWGVSAGYEDNFTPPDEAGMEKAWLSVEQKIAPRAHTPVIRSLSFGKVLLRAAAVILLLVSAAYWIWKPGSDSDTLMAVNTGAGERKEIALPDGSVVWLNENSRLEYRSNFEERRVSLDGEAFFDVRKASGKTFTIRSGEALTTVLGTSFNVRAYPQESGVEVTVKTGKVELKAAKAAKSGVLLVPGDAGVFEKREQKARKIEKNAANADAWKTRSLAFKDMLMGEVITTLERYFQVAIEVENEAILKCQFKMDPLENPNLENIFELLEFTMEVEVINQNGKYRLRGKGC